MLLDRVRERIRRKHYSTRTEQAYCDWIKRFVLFHGKHHPSSLGAAEVEAFLTSLAVDGRVAPSTRNQGVLARLDGVHRLIGALLYGTGLRITEAMRLRVKDVDFGRREIFVRDGKGNKDRVTMLPLRLVSSLREQTAYARELHRVDLGEGFGSVWLPYALARKYPAAAREWTWQYVFPAPSRSLDPRDGVERRHHLSDQAFQRAMKNAVLGAGIHKAATAHTLRHSFATHLLEAGYDIRTVQELLALGRQHHDGLHARSQSRRTSSRESTRSLTLPSPEYPRPELARPPPRAMPAARGLTSP